MTPGDIPSTGSSSPMKAVAALLPALAILAAATPAAAQFRQVQPPPNTWLTVWGGGYTSSATIHDPESGNWNIGSSISGGVGIHRQIGQSLVLGVETSYSPADYEITDADDNLVGNGSAGILTGMATGRLNYGGGGPLGLYLTGGIGTVVYRMPELERWDPDFAFRTGAGLEYRPNATKALFVEWGQSRIFHQKEGVKDNTEKRTDLRAGVRFGR